MVTWQTPKALAWALLIFATGSAQDPCRNFHEIILPQLSPDLICPFVRAEAVAGANCDTLGFLCLQSCGLCDFVPLPPAQCDAAEVFEQKSAAVDILRAWGICGSDCEAPAVWSNHSYVVTAPSLHFPVMTGSYTSSVPGDPCNISGVSCNRCGEITGVHIGYPVGWPATVHVSHSIFRLRSLEILILQRGGAGGFLPPPDNASAPYISADNWASLPNLAAALIYDGVTGDMIDSALLPRLAMFGLSGNNLRGPADNLFGGPSLLALVWDHVIPLEPSLVSQRICNSSAIRIIQAPRISLVGSIPTCLHLPDLEVVLLIGSSLSGPVSQMLNSTKLLTVNIDFNRFTGVLPELLAAGTSLLSLSFEGNQISGTLPDLRNHTGLSLINAAKNRLTGAQALGGSYTTVDLSDNFIEEFPQSFSSLPSIATLDLSRNRIRHWPPAGVYPRGFLVGGDPTSCGFAPELPPFDWPDMVSVLLSGNDLQGQDVRDIMASLAYMPRLRLIEAENCNMTQDLPEEGLDKMLSSFRAEDCNFLVEDGLIGLGALRLAGNHITSFAGGPWLSLQILDLSDNSLTYVHPLWFDDNSQLVSLNFQENPLLQLDIKVPSEDLGCQGATKLTINPSTYLAPSPDAGYECASLCSDSGVVTLVDSVANTSSLCRCRPGWYGIGMSCSLCPEGFFCPGGDSLVKCAANSATKRIGSPLETECECDPGFYRIYNPPNPLRCVECPANTYRPTPNARSEVECFPCEVDTTSAPGTADSCTPCPGGTEPVGSGRGCRVCTAGTYADNLTKTCQLCPFGRFQPNEGAAACIFCEGVANTTWRHVPSEDRYERSIGSSSGAACACASGHRPKGGLCIPCGSGENEGLRCAGGPSTDAVTLLPGYFAAKVRGQASQISVFRCWGDKERCRGGLPGETCNDRRIGLTCAECENGYVLASGGGCDDCQGGSIARLLVAGTLIPIGAAVFYYLIDRHSRAKQSQTQVILSSMVSIGVTAMQQLGLLSQMSIEWKDPLKSFLEAFLVVNFNIELLHLDCLSSTSPSVRFAIRVTMILAFCVLIYFIHVVFVMVRHQGRFEERQSSLVCSVGAMATLFYISVVITISGPLQCQEHPNGKWTSSAYPSVTCWDSDEHTGMVVASMIALLMPMGYLAHAAHTVYSYPARVCSDDSGFLKANEFYFVRFRVECYWFIVVQILRNLILALSVMIPDSAVAVFTALLVHMVCGFFTDVALPWRSGLANLVDIGLTSCVIVLFSGAFNFIPNTSGSNDKLIAWMCFLTVVCALAPLPVCCICAIARKYIKRKPYAFFLCHHKAGGGAFTRLLKIWLVNRTQKEVFVDSDNLAHLDALFHYVRSETQVLVAIWSRELLLRPWCAGEVTVARVNMVKTLTVTLPDHIPVTNRFRESYQHNVNLETIYEYGITMTMVLESLTWLSEQPNAMMADAPCPKVMLDLVTFLRSRRKEQVRRSSQLYQLEYSPPPIQEGSIFILADDEHLEGIATAMVLEKFLLQLQSTTSEAYTLPVGVSLPPSSRAVILMCTGGCLESRPYRLALGVAAANRLAGLPVLAEESFRFPKPEEAASMAALLSQGGVQEYVVNLFKGIAVSFYAQHASEQILRLATDTISRRLEGALICARMASRNSSSDNSNTVGRMVSLKAGADSLKAGADKVVHSFSMTASSSWRQVRRIGSKEKMGTERSSERNEVPMQGEDSSRWLWWAEC